MPLYRADGNPKKTGNLLTLLQTQSVILLLKNEHRRAFWQVHLCVLLWGFTAILGKLITLPAQALVVWRMALVCVFLALLPKVWRGIAALKPKLIFTYAGIGTIVALHWLTFYGAIKLSNASVAVSCLALGSVFAALIEPLLTDKAWNKGELLLGILAIPGVVLLVGGVPLSMHTGIIVGIISAFLASLFAVLNKRYVHDAEPEQKGERRAEVRHPAQAPSLMIAWRGPQGTDPDTLVLDVLQYALSVGQSSRLTRSLVFEQELAVGVSVDWTWRFDPGSFTVVLELKPEGDPKKAEAALYAELLKVAQHGLEPRELEKAKNNLAAHLLRELATNNGRAHALGTYELMLGDWRQGLALPTQYETITSEQVRAAAARYLAPERRSVVTLVPITEVAA